MRLGGTSTIKVNIRLIAATNENLKNAISQARFREDLYYPMNVVQLYIPPLRERKEDIVPLALEILQQLNRELKKNFTGFTPAAADLLEQYPWPGNIRELRNVTERTMILTAEGEIDVRHLPEEIRDRHLEKKNGHKDCSKLVLVDQLVVRIHSQHLGQRRRQRHRPDSGGHRQQ